MRYYEQEHFDAHARIRREGLDQWSDLHDVDHGRGYDNFSNRSFLERMLPAGEQHLSVLEYGCGTGPAVCFLAGRGYRVHAVDLVPDAIEVARQRAAQRGLSIRFEVGDICLWGESGERYDYVVDAFCLQSIVTDEDRSRVLDAVRRRLRPTGRYLLSTSMYRPDREYGESVRRKNRDRVEATRRTTRGRHAAVWHLVHTAPPPPQRVRSAERAGSAWSPRPGAVPAIRRRRRLRAAIICCRDSILPKDRNLRTRRGGSCRHRRQLEPRDLCRQPGKHDRQLLARGHPESR